MKRKGISLIVLIITIVVIIILAAAIILNLSNTNLIENANEAVLKSKAKSLEEAINLWQMENLMNNAIDKSKAKSLGKMLDELQSQNLITVDEREKIESTGKIEIGGKTIELTNVLEIGTKEELEKFRDDVDNGNTYKNKIVKLTANINLQCDANDESTWWNPIGSYEKNINFEGIFDGNGNSVTGIYNEEKGNIEFNAFFSKIRNATIKNLTVDGNVIALPQNSDGVNPAAAGIIGVAVGNCNVINCVNEVDVRKTSSGREVAGVIGCTLNENNKEVIISNCVNRGKIEGANACAGLVATAYSNITINNCYNEGEISNSYGDFAAGLVGREGADNKYIVINNSYNVGKISGKKYVAGIIGFFGNTDNGELSINNCYNTGEINSYTRTAIAYFGGIVGKSYRSGKNVKILNSYNTSDIIIGTSTKSAVVGGIMGENSKGNAAIINCYNVGNLEGEYVGGIMGLISGDEGDKTKLKISNAYNTGNVTGRVYTSGIVRAHISSAVAEFKNTYCLDTAADVLVDNYTTDGVASKDETYMKSDLFVKQLNNNIKQITEENLKEWKYNTNSYPTFK